jgi:hypothetical protein
MKKLIVSLLVIAVAACNAASMIVLAAASHPERDRIARDVIRLP